MKRLLAVLLFVVALVPLFAQDMPMITVLDFSTDGVSKSEMKTIINLLSSALFQTRRFTVIDVNERERLLKELEFSVGECTAESCLLEVGRMLSAERIVVGNIGKVGSRYILSTKMLETETARTLNTADGIYGSLDGLVDDLFGLAEKLARAPGSEAERPSAAAEAQEPAAEAEAQAEAGAGAPSEKPKAAAPREKPPKAARPRREAPTGSGGGYWSLGVEAGTNVPLGAVSEALSLGIPALVRFGYALERDWGVLAFELLSGFQYQGTRADARYGYNLLTAPLGLGVSYSTRWASPWYLSVGAAGGAAFNRVIYKDIYPFRDNLWNTSAFVAPSVGVGYRVSPRLALELDTYLWMVFFTEAVYLGLAPTLGVELDLGGGAAPAAPRAVEREPVGVAEPSENHWTLRARAGADVPLGAMSEALGLGVPVLASLGYTLERPRGAVAFGALTGFRYQGTRADARYGYHLLSVPAGAEISYSTRWASPWYLRAGAAGGALISRVLYKESYPFRDNLWNTSAFVAPSVGAGYRLSPRLALEMDTYLWMVFFTDATYFGLAPALGLKISL